MQTQGQTFLGGRFYFQYRFSSSEIIKIQYKVMNPKYMQQATLTHTPPDEGQQQLKPVSLGLIVGTESSGTRN